MKHQIHAQGPESLSASLVRSIVLVPEEDEAGVYWMQGIAKEWAAELSDPREDIYTVGDGQPVNATR
jgi:hypothetical protein